MTEQGENKEVKTLDGASNNDSAPEVLSSASLIKKEAPAQTIPTIYLSAEAAAAATLA